MPCTDISFALKPVVDMAKMFVIRCARDKMLKIHNAFLADLQRVQPKLVIHGDQVRQRLMKGQGPTIVMAPAQESARNGFQLIFWGILITRSGGQMTY